MRTWRDLRTDQRIELSVVFVAIGTYRCICRVAQESLLLFLVSGLRGKCSSHATFECEMLTWGGPCCSDVSARHQDRKSVRDGGSTEEKIDDLRALCNIPSTSDVEVRVSLAIFRSASATLVGFKLSM